MKLLAPHTSTKDISYKQARTAALPSSTYGKGGAAEGTFLESSTDSWEMGSEKSGRSAFGCTKEQV